LEWPPLKTPTTQGAARMPRFRNLNSLLIEMQNDAAALEDSLAISYKTKYVLTITSSNHASRYLLK
jgi:hypothetical protein